MAFPLLLSMHVPQLLYKTHWTQWTEMTVGLAVLGRSH